MLAIFDEKIEIPKRCKGVHCVDLGESFPTSIYLQKSASIQPTTSPSKFGGKYSILFNRVLSAGVDFPGWSPGVLARCAGRVLAVCWRWAPRRRPPAPPPRTSPALRSLGIGRSAKFQQNLARFRLYRHRSLQVTTRFSASFKIYQIF